MDTRPLRVAVVDDDLWVRTGRVHVLREAGLDVVATDHGGALAGGVDWRDVDVVLVDAWDGAEAWDRFPGVAVVEAVRAQCTPAQALVVVVSGHADNPVLRLRMAEAGADFFYGHDELRSGDELLAAILDPAEARRPSVGGADELVELGLSSRSRLNAVLHDVDERGLRGAFTPARSQKALPHGRRTFIAARRRLSEIGRIADRGRRGETLAPEWRQIVRVVNRARGVDADGTG